MFKWNSFFVTSCICLTPSDCFKEYPPNWDCGQISVDYLQLFFFSSSPSHFVLLVFKRMWLLLYWETSGKLPWRSNNIAYLEADMMHYCSFLSIGPFSAWCVAWHNRTAPLWLCLREKNHVLTWVTQQKCGSTLNTKQLRYNEALQFKGNNDKLLVN